MNISQKILLEVSIWKDIISGRKTPTFYYVVVGEIIEASACSDYIHMYNYSDLTIYEK